MTNGKRRRMMTVLLAFCLLLILAIGAQMWSSLYRQRAIGYDQLYIIPTPNQLCPGEVFTYSVRIEIGQPNSVSEITEGWCVPGGICPDRYDQSPQPKKPFVEPYYLNANPKRVVPEGMPPGTWELRHCNTTIFSGGHDVQCYAVLVTVKDCQ